MFGIGIGGSQTSMTAAGRRGEVVVIGSRAPQGGWSRDGRSEVDCSLLRLNRQAARMKDRRGRVRSHSLVAGNNSLRRIVVGGHVEA